MSSQLFHHRLLKRYPFSNKLLLHHCQKSLGHICVNLFLDSQFCSTELCLSPHQHYSLDYCSCIISLENGKLSMRFLFVFLVCSFVAFSFISHMWVKSYGSWLFLTHFVWHIFEDVPMLLQMQYIIFSYGWIVFHCIHVPHHHYPVIYQRTHFLFPCLGHHA